MGRRDPAGVIHQPAAQGRQLREMPPVTKQEGVGGWGDIIATAQELAHSGLLLMLLSLASSKPNTNLKGIIPCNLLNLGVINQRESTRTMKIAQLVRFAEVHAEA